MTGTTLVTGASGFIGHHVCRHLLRSGHQTRGLCLPSARNVVPGTKVSIASGLDDRSALRNALRGVDTVVHLAARVHVMNETASDALAEFRRVNVEGTRVLLEEAIDAGVAKFLFLSSIKAMGESNASAWTEDTVESPTSPYGISKLEAENVVRELADAIGMQAPILRLPITYGPGVRANMLQLFAAVDRGIPLPLGLVTNRRSFLFCGNLVAAIDAAINRCITACEVYLISDGQDLSTVELVREIARALGRPARLVPVPTLALRAFGKAGDLLSSFAPWPVTSATVDRLLESLTVDPSKFFRNTGFQPPYTIRQGLSDTAQWYREQQVRRVR